MNSRGSDRKALLFVGQKLSATHTELRVAGDGTPEGLRITGPSSAACRSWRAADP